MKFLSFFTIPFKAQKNTLHTLFSTTWSRRLFFLLLSASLCLITLPFRTLYFMEPDDYLLNYIANGSYGWMYSENLVYIRTTLGLLLKGLYHLTGAVNWYAILLLLVILFSFAVFYEMLYLHTGSLPALLFTASLNFFAIPVFFTFTVAAFFSTCAGILMLLEGLRNSCDKKNAGTGERMAGIFFLYFGFALRKDTVLPELILCFPIPAYCLIRMIRTRVFPSAKKSAAIFRKILPALLAGILLFGGDAVIQSKSYRSEQWKFYSSFNEARASVVDYNRLSYDLHQTELENAGLSSIDYAMLSSWKFTDKKVFTVECMTTVGDLARHSFPLAERMADAKNHLRGANLWIFLLPAAVWIMALLLNAACHRKRRLHRALLSGLTLLLWYLLCAALLLYRMRFVPRVSAPLMITASVWILLTGLSREMPACIQNGGESCVSQTSERVPVRKESSLQIICTGLSILFLFLAAGMEVRCIKNFLLSTRYQRQAGSTKYQFVKEKIGNAAASDRLCIIDSYVLSALYYYDHPVKDVLHTDTFRNIVRSGSWDSFSARYYRQAESLNLSDPDRPLLSLVTDPGSIFVSQDASLMQSFLSEQTGKNIQVEGERSAEADVYIYHFHASP